MTFLDRLAANPANAAIACVIWIPLAVWIVSSIGWMISGDMDVVSGALVIFGGIGLGVIASDPPVAWLSPLIFIAVLVATVSFPFARAALNRFALAQIDIEQMERCAQALREKPENVGAMIKLAELLYNRGFPAQAIALADKALPAMPANLFRAEHNMVQAWKRAPQDPQQSPTVPCLRCGAPNPLGEMDCVSCGFSTVIEAAKGRWIGGMSVKQFVAVWIGAAIVLVGLPAAGSLAMTNPVLSLLLVLVQLGVGVTVVLRAFLTGGKHEAA